MIFFDPKHYHHFFNRYDDYQKWIQIANPKLPYQTNLKIDSSFSQRYFIEEIMDEEYLWKQHLLIYGELD